jgi:hypothetical protein
MMMGSRVEALEVGRHHRIIHVAANADEASRCAAAVAPHNEAVSAGAVDVAAAGALVVLDDLGVLRQLGNAVPISVAECMGRFVQRTDSIWALGARASEQARLMPAPADAHLRH